MVVICNFSNFGLKIPFKNKSSITTRNSFENILISSRTKQNLLQTDDGGDFVSKIFIEFSNKNNNKSYSRYTSLGAVFAERFNRTIGDLLKRAVFEKGDNNWIDVLPTITEQYIIRIHISANLTAIPASLKKNGGYVYQFSSDKRKNINQNFK